MPRLASAPRALDETDRIAATGCRACAGGTGKDIIEPPNATQSSATARPSIEGALAWASRRHVFACLLLAVLALALALPGLSRMFPMDRDEPRFTQATKQMLETGDFVNIRFQEAARNKKPVGIYWMQAASVALGEQLGVSNARAALWLYRIPSVLGMLATVLATYWAGSALTSRRGALMAGLLTASTLLLAAEAHLAKTDAVLCATVVASMAVLARAWLARTDAAPLSFAACAAFWTALAIGVLDKGPITPLVLALACLTLGLRARSARWLGKLRPLAGFAWLLLLVLPWFVLIVRNTGMAFFSESIGHDMAAKVASGQEAHGAPPGSYFAAFWLTGWPIAPFVFLAAVSAWRARRTDTVFFLLAWIVPTWLLFEAVPTKLPHYVLPLYPALAILAAVALSRAGEGASKAWRIAVFAALLALPVVCLPIGLALAPGRLSSHVDVATIALAVVALAIAAAAVYGAVQAVRRELLLTAAAAAACASLAICSFVFGWFMNPQRADLIALSPRLAATARASLSPACRAPVYATVGDREPSLVFLTDTRLLMTDGVGAAAFLKEGPCRVAFVDRPWEAAFKAALPVNDARVRLASRVAGVNINGGKKLDIGVYVRQEDAR